MCVKSNTVDTWISANDRKQVKKVGEVLNYAMIHIWLKFATNVNTGADILIT